MNPKVNEFVHLDLLIIENIACLSIMFEFTCVLFYITLVAKLFLISATTL